MNKKDLQMIMCDQEELINEIHDEIYKHERLINKCYRDLYTTEKHYNELVEEYRKRYDR